MRERGSKQTARDGAWEARAWKFRRVEAHARKRRRMVARVARDQRCSIFERCVGVRAVSDGGEASTNV